MIIPNKKTAAKSLFGWIKMIVHKIIRQVSRYPEGLTRFAIEGRLLEDGIQTNLQPRIFSFACMRGKNNLNTISVLSPG